MNVVQEDERDLHKAKSQDAYHQLKEHTMYAKSNPNVVLLLFDLQQTLPTSQLAANVVFYNDSYGHTTSVYTM